MTQSHSAATPVGSKHPVKLISLAVHNAAANHWGRPWRRRTLSVMYPRAFTFKGIKLPTQPLQSWLHLLARAGMLKRRVPSESGSNRQGGVAEGISLPVETPQASSALADLGFEWSSEMIPDFAQFARLSRLKREQDQASVDDSEELSDPSEEQGSFSCVPGGMDQDVSGVSTEIVSPEDLDADFLAPATSLAPAVEAVRSAVEHADGVAAEPVTEHESADTAAIVVQTLQSLSVTDSERAPVSKSALMHSTNAPVRIDPTVSATSTGPDVVGRSTTEISGAVLRDESAAIEPSPADRLEPDSEPAGQAHRQVTGISAIAQLGEPAEHASADPFISRTVVDFEQVEMQRTETVVHEELVLDEPTLKWQSTETTVSADSGKQTGNELSEPVLLDQRESEPGVLPTVETASADVPSELEPQEHIELRVAEALLEPVGDQVVVSQDDAAYAGASPIPVTELRTASGPSEAVASGGMDLESLDEAEPAVPVVVEPAEHGAPEEDTLVKVAMPWGALPPIRQSESVTTEDERISQGASCLSAGEPDAALEPIIASLQDALTMLAAASVTHDSTLPHPLSLGKEEPIEPESTSMGSIEAASVVKSNELAVPPAVPAVEVQPTADNLLEAAVLQGILIQKETEMSDMYDELPEADVQETTVPVTSVELQEVAATLSVPQLEADPDDVLSDVQSTLNSLAGMAQGLTQQKQAAGRLQEELEEWNAQLQERERLAADKEERLQQLEDHLKEAKTNLDRMAAENNRLLAERSEALKELAQTVDLRDKTTAKRAESIQLEQQRIDEQAANLRNRASELDERESALKRKSEELSVRLKQLQSAKDKFSAIVKSFNETVQFNSTLSAISKTVTE